MPKLKFKFKFKFKKIKTRGKYVDFAVFHKGNKIGTIHKINGFGYWWTLRWEGFGTRREAAEWLLRRSEFFQYYSYEELQHMECV